MLGHALDRDRRLRQRELMAVEVRFCGSGAMAGKVNE